MLCKIYRTTFELNHNKKLKRVIASLCDGPYRYDNYYYYKPNVLEPIMKPYNFHFNEWELIIWNFNPELPEHWTYFSQSVSCGVASIESLDFLNEWSSEWMPRDAKKTSENILYRIQSCRREQQYYRHDTLYRTLF